MSIIKGGFNNMMIVSSLIIILILGIIIIVGLVVLLLYLSKKKSVSSIQETSTHKSQPVYIEPPEAKLVELSLNQDSISLIENKISDLSSFLNKKIVEKEELINFQGVTLKVENLTPDSPAKITSVTEINISLV